MAKEIEKKYLLEDSDILKRLIQNSEIKSIKQIEQTYLSATDGEEVRIRSSYNLSNDNKEFHLTTKSSGGLVREENEIAIDERTFINLKQNVCHNPTLQKDRYSILLNGIVVEIDFYKDSLDHLITAEIEIESEDEIYKLDFMNELSFVIKDITEDSRYKNKNLWKSII